MTAPQLIVHQVPDSRVPPLESGDHLTCPEFENKIDWYALTDGDYQLLPVEGRVICSRRFPGLWLAVEAMLRGEMAQVLTVLQAGLRSPEHAAFVASANQRPE